MANRQNRKGRSRGEAKHVRLYEWELSTPAYRALHPYSRALLIEFRRRFNGGNNGHIHMSILEAQKSLGVGRKAAYRGLEELQEYGFIKITKKGVFTVRESSRDGTEWALTNEQVGDRPPTKDYVRWTDEMVRQKQKAVSLGNTLHAPREHGRAEKRPQNTPDHAPQEHGKGDNPTPDRVPQVHTYSIPGSTAPAARGTITREQVRQERLASERRLYETMAAGEQIRRRFEVAVLFCALVLQSQKAA